MTTMTNTANFWTKLAEKYAKHPIKDMSAYTYTLGRTRSYLGAEDKVLELGCGTASTALLLAPSVKEYHATDISDGMIAVGKRKLDEQGVDNLKLSVGDIAKSTAQGPYDAVLALNLLHLVKDFDAALGRIAQSVRPGGLFISKTICKPEGFGGRIKLGAMMGVLPIMQLLGKAPYVKIRLIRDFEAAITGQGFQIIETGNYPANPPSRYIVARKL